MSKITKRGVSPFIKRGVLLPSMKQPAASRPIIDIAPPSRIVIPLLAGDGSECLPAIKSYDTVLKGDVLGISETGDGGRVYSPVSGVYVGTKKILHPIIGNVTCALLDCMATGGETGKFKDTASMSEQENLEMASSMGIIDELDGQPLGLKLAAWRKLRRVMLVADATEQEPYCSASRAVLKDSAVQVRDGLALAARAMGAKGFCIAVMLPQKRLSALKAKLNDGDLFSVKGRYPVELPSIDGCIVCRIGVQACLALYRAAAYGEPPCGCVVTIAGDAVANPQNVQVPYGALVEDVLRFCGLAHEPEYVLLGDVMTGITVQDADVPTIPGITCILAFKSRVQSPLHACIGCGRCVSACHRNLLPYEIMRRLDNMQYERLSQLLPDECDGCGACSYVCPSGLEVTAKVLEARDAQGNIFMKWGDGDEL